MSIREPGINDLFSSFAGSIALKFHAEVAFLDVLLFATFGCTIQRTPSEAYWKHTLSTVIAEKAFRIFSTEGMVAWSCVEADTAQHSSFSAKVVLLSENS